MIITKIARRFLITKVTISKMERFKPFEIRLPANVKKVTGIAITASRQ